MIKKIINFLIELKADFLSNKKLKKIKHNLVGVSQNQSSTNEYLKRWSILKSKPSVSYPKIFSAINGISSSAYVPENIYYNRIESVLNNKAFALAYADKNFYERFLRQHKNRFPDSILRGINGVFFDADYNFVKKNDDILSQFIENESYILKPSTETSGGANVSLVRLNNRKISYQDAQLNPVDFIRILANQYKGNFVIQKKIIQQSWFKDFNDSSLNTVRIFTYRSVLNEVVHPLHAVVRFGRPGSIVDNQAAGGLTCGINNEGKLNDFACEKYGIIHRELPFVKTKSGQDIPFFKDMKTLAQEIAPFYGYHRLLGFDFCVDANYQVRLLEINCKNIETNFLQMNNGPLFGSLTDEIIDYCKKHPKSVVLDFYV